MSKGITMNKSAYQAMKLTKLECAKRQLVSAVKLYFERGDAVSIHTLTCAAYNVLLALNRSAGGVPMFAKEEFLAHPNPGHPSLANINAYENFFKHADRDPSVTLDFDPRVTEALLIDACGKFHELSGEREPSLATYCFWFLSQRHNPAAVPAGFESFAEITSKMRANDEREQFYQVVMPMIKGPREP